MFTASDANAKVTATCAQATKDIVFVGEIPEPYTGIVYVSPDGSDRNNGSAEAPVASIAKAIQIATAETGSGQIVIKEGTYKGTDYLITKDLEIVGEMQANSHLSMWFSLVQTMDTAQLYTPLQKKQYWTM